MINPVTIQLKPVIHCPNLATVLDTIRCVLSCIVFQRSLNVVEVKQKRCKHTDIWYPKVQQNQINDSISEYLQSVETKIKKGLIQNQGLIEVTLCFMTPNNTSTLFNSLFSKKYIEFEVWQFSIQILNSNINTKKEIKYIMKEIIIHSTKYSDCLQLSDNDLCFHGCYQFKISDNLDEVVKPKSKSIIGSIFGF